jgi:WD40 repeat protein
MGNIKKQIVLISSGIILLSSCNINNEQIEPCIILSGHKHKVNSVDYSQDGRYLISAGWDNTVIKWDLENSGTKVVLRGHTDNIWDCTISADGRFIGSASMDNSFIIWDFESGRQVFRYKIEPSSIINRGVIPELDSKFPNSVYDIEFSPDNKFIAIASADHLVRIFDLSGFELIKTLDLHNGWVLELKFSEDGKFLISGGYQSEIIIWETESFTPLQILKNEDSGNGSFVLSDNDSKLLTIGDSIIYTWDIKKGEIINSSAAPHALQGFQFIREGKYVISSAEDHTVRIWSTESGNAIWVYHNPKPEIGGFTISPDGSYFAVATPESDILIWKIEDIIKTGRHESK